MLKKKRKSLIRIAERVAVALFVADVLVYSILVLGLSDRIGAASKEFDAELQHAMAERLRISQLEQYRASLPDSKKQLAEFEQQRVPSRRQGYSRAAQLIREISTRSGVNVSAVSYKLDSGKSKPLDRLGVTVTAQGLYPGLIKFARSLETADDFMVVRDFNFQQGDNGMLSLRLSADLYLTP